MTNKGVASLQKAGLIEKVTQIDRNAQNRELREIFIAHRLLVSHIRATFMLACQANPDLEFLFWREGKELQDTIEVALPEKYAKIPVAPDGFFGLRDAKGRTHYFVEADRGTMTTKRFTLKLKAYAAYVREKRHERKFNIKHFRVLTVTTSRVRCKNLLDAAVAAEDIRKDGRMFLFTTEKDLPLSSPESVLNKIWTIPGKSERASLTGG